MVRMVILTLPACFSTLNMTLLLFSFGLQIKYGEFMHGLNMENVQLNRKVLSEIAMHEPYSFKALTDIAKTVFFQKLAAQPKPKQLPLPGKTSMGQ